MLQILIWLSALIFLVCSPCGASPPATVLSCATPTLQRNIDQLDDSSKHSYSEQNYDSLKFANGEGSFQTVGPLIETADATRTSGEQMTVNLDARNRLEAAAQKQAEKMGPAYNRGCGLVGGGCCPFFLEDDPHTMMFGERGTAFRADMRTVTLQQGKIVALLGKMPVKLITGFGDVSLAENSTAIIQQTESGVTRIANLVGETASFTIDRAGRVYNFAISAGEELCVATAKSEEEALVPADEVEREQISIATSIPGLAIIKNAFDQKMMVAKERLLICNAGSFYQAVRKVKLLKDRIEREARPFHSPKINPSASKPLAVAPLPEAARESVIVEPLLSPLDEN